LEFFNLHIGQQPNIGKSVCQGFFYCDSRHKKSPEDDLPEIFLEFNLH